MMTGLTGAAGFCLGGNAGVGMAAAATVERTDEDGYRLWLRYASTEKAAGKQREIVRRIRVDGSSGTCRAIRDELGRATTSLLGNAVPMDGEDLTDGILIVGTPKVSPLIRGLDWLPDLTRVGEEGYIIRSGKVDGRSVTVIAANEELGALYGTFHFLRLMQTGRPLDKLDIVEKPALQLRLTNHWDNPDGTKYFGRFSKRLVPKSA